MFDQLNEKWRERLSRIKDDVQSLMGDGIDEDSDAPVALVDALAGLHQILMDLAPEVVPGVPAEVAAGDSIQAEGVEGDLPEGTKIEGVEAGSEADENAIESGAEPQDETEATPMPESAEAQG